MRAGDPLSQRIIYVHGTPGDASNWDDYIRNPLPKAESVAYDRPGFGKTRPTHAMVSLRDQAKVLEPLLVNRDGSWPILVGHSLGGSIIVQAAVDYPDRVGGLVIIAGALDPDLESPQWYNQLADWPLVKVILPHALRVSNEEIIPLKTELGLLKPDISSIRCPVVIIHGSRDRLVPVENLTFIAERLGDVVKEALIVEGEDHFIIWNNAELIRKVISEMVENR
jgi:pimeloyl-ACP methyl ester carboxylesterase